MNTDSYVTELEVKLSPTFEKLKNDMSGIRSGRPSPQLIENIQVEYAGGTLPIRQLGSISVRPPRELTVHVWDRNAVQSVVKAIQDAQSGLSVTEEGAVIRCFLPPLSEERRAEMQRLVSKTAEAARIIVRTARDEVNKKIKAAETRKELDKDAAFTAKERIQKVVVDVNARIEDMVAAKNRELLE